MRSSPRHWASWSTRLPDTQPDPCIASLAGIKVRIAVVAAPGQRPPVGAVIRVEARDSGLADAAAEVIAAAEGSVMPGSQPGLDVISLDLPRLPRHTTLRAHVDVDGDGRVGRGDYVTTQSYAVAPGAEEIRVVVRKV